MLILSAHAVQQNVGRKNVADVASAGFSFTATRQQHKSGKCIAVETATEKVIVHGDSPFGLRFLFSTSHYDKTVPICYSFFKP